MQGISTKKKFAENGEVEGELESNNNNEKAAQEIIRMELLRTLFRV